MRWLLALAALAGCDQVFGIDHHGQLDAQAAIDAGIDAPQSESDLDDDGISDDIDPCIAAPEDEKGDEDSDQVPNATDTCPFNPVNESIDIDMDSDGMPDICDPFPMMAVDQPRCFTTFASPTLSARLWHGRTGEPGWATNPDMLAADPSATQTWTSIAAENLEGHETTTYTAAFAFDPEGRDGSLTFWLRASATGPLPADVGCRYAGSSGGTMGVIGPNGLQDPHIVALVDSPHTLRIQGSITTVSGLGTNVMVTCRFTLDARATQTATATVALPAGRVGFSSEHWEATVRAMAISDR